MKCKQCGNCCIDVGRTWWKIGDYKSINAGLAELSRNGDHEDSGLACEMLIFEHGKTLKATCLIHKLFGYDAKPDICKAHKGDERCKI
jgi:hypothetical protein